MGTTTRAHAPTKKSVVPGRVRYERVLVTDAIARYWLEHNAPNNRGPKGRKLRQYAHDMLTPGGWVDTGDCIKITSDPWVDADGEKRTDDRMIDGSQRMRALRLAAETEPDIAVEMTFAYGVPFEAIYVTDTGSARTFADGLGFKERINKNSHGAIVRRVWYWNAGNFIAAGGTNAPYADPTMRDLHQLEESDIEGFVAATNRGMDIRTAKVGNPTAAGTAYYVLSRIDHEEAGTFFDHLIKGAGPLWQETFPVLALRDRLITAHLTLNRAQRLTTTEQLYLIMRAWNAFRKDETLTTLVLPPKGQMSNARFIRPI